jgi:hypothetical protein
MPFANYQDYLADAYYPIFITKPKFQKSKARDFGLLFPKKIKFGENVVTTF